MSKERTPGKAMERMSDVLKEYAPSLTPGLKSWRERNQAKAVFAKHGSDKVERLLVYLNTASQDHDGLETHRRAYYVVNKDEFICVRTGNELKNVEGWVRLDEL
jgi:hypothetical protein